MLSRNHTSVQTLERLMMHECQLFEQYSDLVKAEKESVSKFDTKKTQEIVIERQRVQGLMSGAQQKRLLLLQQITERPGENLRLSDVIREYCHPDDVKRLAPLVSRMRSSAKKLQGSVSELGGLVNFSLGMVNSLLSIIWSASQTVVDSYGPQGRLNKQYQPSSSTRSGIVRQG